ncbi:ATP-binding cassette domain-containing protein [Occultella glacieicola]|uniref:ATP-binding cassette domain-containing protein n=1 Tax=Occultella glacieicola TaxID=2518684 RepID=A0ABY2E749_9MICO|nr:ATP-binding cassette domain-containing protein [Occultella glacieicola]TDE97381.1 ATP-binding cassette domain-containing protein [Occultella glacieicola]
MTTAIDVQGVTKSFGSQSVLAGIDLRVERGTVFALLGPNGAGKTTLVNILSTLVQADGGSARIEGADLRRDPGGVRRRIRLTGQSAAVDELLTGAENLRMMGALAGLRTGANRRRTTELLRQFGLADAADKAVKAYSGGMRRRLDIALSLVTVPQVLFLDEPTTGLDLRSRLELWDVIRSLRAEGTTILLTTQYLEEADQLADRIAVLRTGRIVAEGTPTELKQSVGGEVVEVRGPDGELLHEMPTDGSVHALREALDLIDARGLAGPAGTVGLRRPSLDDVFLALTDPDAVAGTAPPTGPQAGSQPATDTHAEGDALVTTSRSRR